MRGFALGIIMIRRRGAGTKAGMAEIFVSYTSSDGDWAFWIGQELEALGHLPHIHEWELSGGANIMACMTAQTNAADHVPCVVSEKYLKAPHSSLERTAAEWAAVKRRPNFALPVYVEPCDPPLLFAPLKRCDLHGITEDEARARLAHHRSPAQAMEPAGRPLALHEVGPVTLCSKQKSSPFWTIYSPAGAGVTRQRQVLKARKARSR